MSDAAAIVGATGAITFGNEWLQGGKVNWLIIPATAVAMVGFSLLEKVSTTAAVGLAVIALLTELMVPFHGRKTPLTELMDTMGYNKKG